MWTAALLCLTVVSAGAETPTPTTSLLVMPFTAKDDAPAQLAEHVSALMAYRAGQRAGFSVMSIQEVQGMLSQEQLKQVNGCSDVSCAAEIGGALSADQIVIGSLGVVASEYLITTSRIETRKSRVLARAARRVPRGDDGVLLDVLDSMALELFDGVAPPSTPPAPPRRAAAPQPSEKKPAGNLLWRGFQGLGGVGAGGALVVFVGSGAALVTALAITGVDLAGGDWAASPRQHGTKPWVALVGDGAYGLGLALLVLSVVGAGLSGILLAVGTVMA